MGESNDPFSALTPAKPDHLIDQVLKAVSIPVAMFSGFFVLQRRVNKNAYDVAKSHGAFDKEMHETSEKARLNLQQGISGEITAKEFQKTARKLRRNYSESVKKTMQKLELDDFPKVWHHISKDAREKAIIEGMTVAGIAVGALLTIADNRWLSGQLKRDDKDEKSRE